MRKFLYTALLVFGFGVIAQTPILDYSFDGTVKTNIGSIDGILVNGGTFVANRFGEASSALSLDGINQYIDMDNGGAAIVSTNQITFEGWFNSNDFSNTQSILNIPELIVFVNDSGFPGMAPQDGVSSSLIISSTAINKNQWFHLAATYDGSIAKIYVNGVETGSSQLDKTLQTSSGVTNVGANNGNSNVFPGLMDEVSFYNFALTGSEVLALYQEGAFITTWQTTTDGESITIPTFSSEVYNYTVDWGDGTTESAFSGDATHIYATANTYNISIYGEFPRIYFNFGDNGQQTEKIMSIEQWGDISWQSMHYAFAGCNNLIYNASDAPDLTNVIEMSGMFYGASSFQGADLTGWNVSNVNYMSFLFAITDFNGDVSNWDVSNVFSAISLFDSTPFNGDISAWDVSSMEDFSQMFLRTPNFNGDITGWDMASASQMNFMFSSASSFNQDISGWNVSNATEMTSMFNSATSFDQNLGSWDISSIGATGVAGMFANSGMSIPSYDNTLIGWSTLDAGAGETLIPAGITFDANGIFYCHGEYARNELVNTYGWTINGDSKDCRIAQYNLNGDALDNSGNGNDGTADGAQPTVDRFGNTGGAYAFDGVDDFISTASLSEMPENITFSAWFYYPSSASSGTYQIAEINGSSALALFDGAFQTVLNLNGVFEAPAISASADEWHHGAFTYDGTTFRSYLDGLLFYEQNNAGPIVYAAGSEVNIGKAGTANFFSGAIDDVNIYLKAFSAEEIQAQYLVESGVIASYSFSGSAIDDTGNGNDGTVNGATLGADRFGNANAAYDFDGATSYIEISSDDFLVGRNQLSMSWWVYTNTSTVFQDMLSFGNVRAFITEDGFVNVNTQVGGSATPIGTEILQDQWEHFVYTYDGSTAILYRNGVEVSQLALSGTIDASGGAGLLGALTSTDNHLNGSLDDIKLYDYAISGTEVLELYSENQWPVTSIQITGTALTGANNSEQRAMFKSGEGYYASAYLYDGSIRFQANGVPSINWGDDDQNGIGAQDEADILVTEGLYRILFNPANSVYDLTEITSVGFLGSARTGDFSGWDGPDTDMTNLGEGIFQLNSINLFVGDWKVRANDVWGLINWGGGNRMLEPFGLDISILKAGNYKIIVDVNNQTYKAILTDPLVRYVLNGGIGDVSGNNVPTTLSTGTANFVTDRFGDPSIALNLSDTQHLVVDNGNEPLVSGNEITFEGWFRPTSLPATGTSQFLFNTPGAIGYINDNGFPVFGPVDGSSVYTLATTEPLVIGEWFHYAATYDGSVGKVYINGVEVLSQEINITLSRGLVSTQIGASVNGGSTFQGDIDDLRIFDSAIDAPIVRAIYASGGYAVPRITGVFPKSGAPGESIRIYGNQLAEVGTIVTLNGTQISPNSLSDNVLYFTVPDIAVGAGSLAVGNDFNSSFSQNFSVLSVKTEEASFAAGNVIASLTDTPVELYTNDFNNDGYPDIISGAFNEGVLRLYQNDGLGGFSLSQILYTSLATGSVGFSRVAYGDFDNDGDEDIVSTYNADLHWFVNGGAGLFSADNLIETASLFSEVKSGDINGDGNIDIVVIESGAVKWYSNDGDAFFTNEGTISSISNGERLSLNDFDNDGDIDIARAGSQNYYLVNNGNGVFSEINLSTPSGGSGSITTSDFNNDGLLDIAIGSSSATPNLDVYINNGGGFNAPSNLNSDELDSPYDLTSGDLDGDGDQELLTASFGASRVTSYLNDGSAGFTPTVVATGITGASRVEASDIDNDGDLDIVVSRESGEIIWYENASTSTEFLAFSFSEERLPAVIDAVNHTIDVEIVPTSDITSLTASFTLGDGATVTIGGVNQESDVTVNDFTNSLVYTVTAGDGSTQDWTVSVTQKQSHMLTFGLQGEINAGVIDYSNQSITLGLGQGFDITNMTAEFTLSAGATATVNGVAQVSGENVNDFTNPVVYVVNGTDGTTSNYIIYVDQTFADGLIVYYPFTGNAEEQIIGYNGTLNGDVVLTADRFGNADQAYSFDGGQDFIQTDFTPVSDEAFSLSYWAFWDQSFSDYREMIGFSTQDNLINTYFGVAANDQLRARDELGVSMAIGKWNHLVFTYDGNGTLQCYLDNVLVFTQSDLTNYPFGPLTIGAFSRDGGESWNGDLDDIRFYNRVISTQEIEELYREDGWIPEQGAVIAQYSYTGNADDISGNSRHGTLGNGSNDDNSPTLTTDRFDEVDNAYYYDGTDYITYLNTASIDLGNHITVAAWINSNTFVSGEPQIISNGSGSTGFDFKLSGSDEISKALKAEIFGTGTFLIIGELFPDQWYHVAFTYARNGSMILYLDGIEIGSIPAGDFPIAVSSADLISGVTMDGTIDELIIYDEALSATSIYDLYYNSAPISNEKELLSFKLKGGITPDDGYILMGDFDGSRYYQYSGGATWEAGQNAAVTFGGNLASINSQEENDFLQNNISASVWIGGRDENSEDNYEWVDGSPFSYTSWDIGEPNGSTGENHIEFTTNGVWNDRAGTEVLSFVVEIPIYQGTLDVANKSVEIEVPFNTDMTTLVADFNVSDKATVFVNNVTQISGSSSNDFTNPVIYTLEAQDMTSDNWVVSVTKDVLEGDSLALVALYNSTDGANWASSWDLGQPMNTWSGISLNPENRVISIDLAGNNLVGSIPSEIGQLSEITYLNLGSNDFSGSGIPIEIGNLLQLEELLINNASLSGSIPTELANLSSLRHLYLYSNQLSGELPIALGDLSGLARLDLGDNQLTGAIPTELGNLTSLTDLYLYNNLLSGSIPSSLGQLSTLFFLGLDGNELTGEIPSELGDLSLMVVLDLSRNNLSGSLPASLANISTGGNLQGVYLSDNAFTGSIPAEFGNFGTSLHSLLLSGNQLTGSIPSELGNLSNLRFLNLEGNLLSGAIPTEIGNLSNLESLHIGYNDFTGAIPASFVNLTSLLSLGVENNRLDGLPDLTSLPLSGEGIALVNNKIGFTDIITNLSIEKFSYDGQVLDEVEAILVTAGNPVTLTTSEVHPNTSYQWTKDGSDITVNGTSSTYLTEEIGTYTVVMTNSSVAGLTITREPYVLTGDDATDFVSFSFDGIDATGSIDLDGHAIAIEVPFGTNLDNSIPVFELSPGASADIGGTPQTSGEGNVNFTSPITYTITAQNGITTQDWTVTATVGGNPANDIESFTIDGQISSNVDANSHTVSVVMPFGVARNDLFPNVTISANATISPETTVAQNFDNPFTYTVTSESLVAQEWIVTVTNEVNNTPTDITITNSSIDENLSVGTTIGFLNTVDPDGGDTHNYSIVGGASGDFNIVGNELQSATVFNFEDVTSYSITVRTFDGKDGEYFEEIIININDVDETVNQAPFIFVRIADEILEASAEFTISIPANTFGDPNGDQLTLSASKADGSGLPTWLTFDPINEEFTGSAPSSAENVDIRVTAADGGGLNISDVFNIDVQVFNTAPTISDQSFSVDEDISNGVNVGTIVANDTDGDQLTYSITSGNESGAFAISATLGELTVADQTQLDFETTSSYTLTVQVADALLNASANISISVNNVNEPTNFSNVSIPTSYTAGDAFDVSATITDEDGLLTYNLVYKKVSQTDFSSKTLVKNGDSYSASLSDSEIGSIGVEFYVEVTDVFGSEKTSTSTVSVAVPAGAKSVNSKFSPGTTVKDYSILAFPFKSVSIQNTFGAIGTYDEDWRLVIYQNGSFSDKQSGNTSAGAGYWFITKNQSASVAIGGESVTLNDDGSYTVSLSPDGENYSLIGNPFQGTINWEAVKTFNAGSGVTISNLIRYNGGFNSEQTSLPELEGAFVQATGISSLRIPASAISGGGGRTTEAVKRPQEVFIDDNDWKVDLFFTTPSYDYSVGGVGINTNAEDGRDGYDLGILPRLELYLDLLFEDGSTRSIKKSGDFKSWQFNVRNNLPEEVIDMTWDIPVSSNKTIILVDGASQKIYDLKETKSIQLKNDPTATHQLYYGDKETIFENLDLPFDAYHSTYPNPVQVEMTVEMYAHEQRKVSISLVGLDGKSISIGQIQLYEGLNSEKINLEEYFIPAGVYFLKVDSKVVTKILKQ